MRYLFVLLICTIAYANLNAQSKVIYFNGDTTRPVSKTATPDVKEWQQHILGGTQLDSTFSAKIPDGTYEALISFVVNKHGFISKVKIIKDPGYGLGKIAAKIIESYKGKWQPATEGGKSISAGYKQPIIFVIDTEK